MDPLFLFLIAIVVSILGLFLLYTLIAMALCGSFWCLCRALCDSRLEDEQGPERELIIIKE